MYPVQETDDLDAIVEAGRDDYQRLLVKNAVKAWTKANHIALGRRLTVDITETDGVSAPDIADYLDLHHKSSFDIRHVPVESGYEERRHVVRFTATYKK